MALVHFASRADMGNERAECWRFWLGSRNLVAAENAELGLCLESTEGSKGQEVPGLMEAATWLAARAGYDGKEIRELKRKLKNLRWSLPEGCSAVSIKHHEGAAYTAKLPDTPTGISRLIVVSPFLDVATVGALGRWGDESTSRTIVSTEEWLRKVEISSNSPLKLYRHVLVMAKPELEGDENLIADGLEEMDEQVDFPYQRLHAKLIGVKHGRNCTLWMGSANATDRGWSGRNVELTAKIQANSQVWEGLESWSNDRREVDRAALRMLVDPETEADKTLKRERNRLSAVWNVKLSFESNRTLLMSTGELHPLDPKIELSVRLLTQFGMQLWPRGAERLELPPAKLADRTSFVCVSLTHSDGAVAEWVQCCPVDPRLDEERDTAALGEYLGAANLLAWWRSLLRDGLYESEEDLTWDAEMSGRQGKEEMTAVESDSITLEDMLRSWTRDPDSFIRDGERIASLLKGIDSQDADVSAALKELRSMQDLWHMIGTEA